MNYYIPRNLTVAGDRAYVANVGAAYPAVGSIGRVQAYDTATGILRTVLVPGKEVAHRTGFLDLNPYAIAAIKLTDGRRFLFAEDVYMGRVVIYRDH